ncbi:family upf0121 protein [Cystoisospora suis]|uniref:Family upf0121 protein n=1 Tax=Cystoisospora suis TaxID=483139 RepID=A0A2C6KYP7_9APIC|nr:family upf0121 protein [Cystoisospora suis]
MVELSEADKAFLAYDWGQSKKWLEYFDSLYPTPPADKVLKWKKKFFKAHENRDFDPNSQALAEALGEKPSSPPSASTSSSPWRSSGSSPTGGAGSSCPYSSSSYQGSSNVPGTVRASFLRHKVFPLLCLSGLFCGLCFTLTGLYTRLDSTQNSSLSLLGLWLLAASFLLHLFMTLGYPPIPSPLSLQALALTLGPYIQRAAYLDSVHALSYLLFTIALPPSFALYLSPSLSSILIWASLLQDPTSNGIPALIKNNRFIHTGVSKIQSNRMRLLQYRADVEVFLGLLFIVSRIVTLDLSLSNSVFPALMYIHLLRLRHATCGFTHTTCRRIDAFFTRIVTSPSCPAFVGSLYGRVQAICRYVIKPQYPSSTTGEAASQQRCVIQ